MFENKYDYLINIKDMLAAQLCIDAADINTETNLCDAGIDSLDRVEISSQLDEVYDIEVSDRDAAKWKTVGDIVTYLDSLELAISQ